MYILVAVLGLGSAYFMLRALRQGSLWSWLAYVLSTAMAMNAHYFAVFLIPFQNVYMVYLTLRRNGCWALWKGWLLSQAAVALLSVVGLAGIFSAESDYWWGLLDTWHGAPTWRSLVSLMYSFSLGTMAEEPLLYWGGLALFGFCAAWGLVVFEEQRPALLSDDGLVFAVLYLTVPLGVIFLFSQFRSFWVLRYIFPFLPPYCIIVARGIAKMPGRFRGPLLLLTMALISLWPIVHTYRHEQKENWRAAVGYISAEERADDVILMVDEDIWLPFDHYYRGSVRRVGISRTVTDRSFLAMRVGMLLPHHSRIWLVLSHTDNLALKEYLVASQYAELVSERNFTGVEVDLFAVWSN
jgi:hypothetical protein